MTLYRKHGIWWVAHTRDGKRVQKSTGTRSKAEARRFADSLELAVKAPTFEAAVEFLRMVYADSASRTKLDEAWPTYERIAKSVGRASVAESTWRSRRERVAALVRWIREERPSLEAVEQVDGRVAAAYAQHLAAAGKATKTRKCIISDLSTVWTLLAKASTGLDNPWRGLAPRDVDGERLEAFTDGEVKLILAEASRVGDGWWLACKLSLETGLRFGDVSNLRWSQVSEDCSVIRLAPAKTASRGIRVAIPIVDVETRAELARARKWAAGREAGTMDAEYVLPKHAAVYGDTGRGRERFRFANILAACGIDSKTHTFHSFRHTFRSRLAAAGVDTDTAMRLCGHTERSTSERYDHDEHLEENRRAIEAAMKGAFSGSPG